MYLNTIRALLVPRTILCHAQYRQAGHAKWQNIRHTKLAQDGLKAKLNGRIVFAIKKAIVSNNRQTDPKLNRELAAVLVEAARNNVCKATVERAIERTKNMKFYTVTIEIEGPAKSSILLKAETDNAGFLRRDVRKVLKKFEAFLLPDDSIINMFRNQGCVRTELTKKDGKAIDMDEAEEAAIEVNAEEVYIEDNGEEKTYVFITNPDIVNQSSGQLQKLGFKVKYSESDLVPYRKVEYDQATLEKIEEVVKSLRALPDVIDVYTNC